MASWGVTASSAWPMVFINAGSVRASKLRRICLSLLHIFSIGLKSGESAGKKSASAPACRISARMTSLLWGGGVDAPATLGPATQTGQVGFGSGFIEEDQARQVQRRLPPPPVPSCPGDVRPVLFAGAERLFLYVSPISSNT
jgi:hypothetical protein